MLDRSKVTLIFEAWARKMGDKRDYLIELDSVVGDGDLGLTMSDGFAAAAKQVSESTEPDLGKTFYAAGKIMSTTVPSTMGTLMASGLMSIGKFAKGKLILDLSDFAGCMDAFLQGVMNLGKAKVGDKTFLDGMQPAVDVLQKKAEENAGWPDALLAAAAAARQGFEQTATIVAVHGRAATRGEASRSLLDPGAAVAMLLMEALAEISGQLQA